MHFFLSFFLSFCRSLHVFFFFFVKLKYQQDEGNIIMCNKISVIQILKVFQNYMLYMYRRGHENEEWRSKKKKNNERIFSRDLFCLRRFCIKKISNILQSSEWLSRGTSQFFFFLHNNKCCGSRNFFFSLFAFINNI